MTKKVSDIATSDDNAEAAGNDPELWGGCPTCGRNDTYLNLGPNHWFVCHRHRVRWCCGANLFSTWRCETDADWHENFEIIGDYAVVEPVYGPEQE